MSMQAGAGKGRLILYAPVIYTGGGKTLLLALLNAIESDSGRWEEVRVMVDARCRDLPSSSKRVKIGPAIRPGSVGRLQAERTLQRLANEGDVVFCLGNLPPLFPIKGTVVGFIQNAHLLETPPGRSPTRKKKIERWWFKRYQHHCRLFIVQTPTMCDRLLRFIPMDPSRILVLPFQEAALTSSYPETGSARQWDFGYVSLPWAHKNHRRLIEAFVLLAREGLHPSLVVTVPEAMDAGLYRLINQVRERDHVRVTNLGSVEYRDIGKVYQACGALIFPSLIESFALPLLEAQAFGLPILAPERDYVRDVVVPRETFDPESPRSMMRAMKRFLGNADPPASVYPARHVLEVLYGMGAASSSVSSPAGVR